MAAFGLIILEMKAGNELAISLLVYFKSVKKMKICVKKKTTKKTVKKKISYGRRELNPGPSMCKVSCHDNYC